jgi:hypothetical protein
MQKINDGLVYTIDGDLTPLTDKLRQSEQKVAASKKRIEDSPIKLRLQVDDKALSEAQKKLDKRLSIKVAFDTTDSDKKLEAIQKRLTAFAKPVKINLDTQDAERKIDGLKTRMGGMAMTVGGIATLSPVTANNQYARVPLAVSVPINATQQHRHLHVHHPWNISRFVHRAPEAMVAGMAPIIGHGLEAIPEGIIAGAAPFVAAGVEAYRASRRPNAAPPGGLNRFLHRIPEAVVAGTAPLLGAGLAGIPEGAIAGAVPFVAEGVDAYRRHRRAQRVAALERSQNIDTSGMDPLQANAAQETANRPSVNAIMSLPCPVCGNANPITASHCTRCGANLKGNRLFRALASGGRMGLRAGGMGFSAIKGGANLTEFGLRSGFFAGQSLKMGMGIAGGVGSGIGSVYRGARSILGYAPRRDSLNDVTDSIRAGAIATVAAITGDSGGSESDDTAGHAFPVIPVSGDVPDDHWTHKHLSLMGEQRDLLKRVVRNTRRRKSKRRRPGGGGTGISDVADSLPEVGGNDSPSDHDWRDYPGKGKRYRPGVGWVEHSEPEQGVKPKMMDLGGFTAGPLEEGGGFHGSVRVPKVHEQTEDPSDKLARLTKPSRQQLLDELHGAGGFVQGGSLSAAQGELLPDQMLEGFSKSARPRHRFGRRNTSRFVDPGSFADPSEMMQRAFEGGHLGGNPTAGFLGAQGLEEGPLTASGSFFGGGRNWKDIAFGDMAGGFRSGRGSPNNRILRQLEHYGLPQGIASNRLAGFGVNVAAGVGAGLAVANIGANWNNRDNANVMAADEQAYRGSIGDYRALQGQSRDQLFAAGVGNGNWLERGIGSSPIGGMLMNIGGSFTGISHQIDQNMTDARRGQEKFDSGMQGVRDIRSLRSGTAAMLTTDKYAKINADAESQATDLGNQAEVAVAALQEKGLKKEATQLRGQYDQRISAVRTMAAKESDRQRNVDTLNYNTSATVMNSQFSDTRGGNRASIAGQYNEGIMSQDSTTRQNAYALRAGALGNEEQGYRLGNYDMMRGNIVGGQRLGARSLANQNMMYSARHADLNASITEVGNQREQALRGLNMSDPLQAHRAAFLNEGFNQQVAGFHSDQTKNINDFGMDRNQQQWANYSGSQRLLGNNLAASRNDVQAARRSELYARPEFSTEINAKYNIADQGVRLDDKQQHVAFAAGTQSIRNSTKRQGMANEGMFQQASAQGTVDDATEEIGRINLDPSLRGPEHAEERKNRIAALKDSATTKLAGFTKKLEWGNRAVDEGSFMNFGDQSNKSYKDLGEAEKIAAGAGGVIDKAAAATDVSKAAGSGATSDQAERMIWFLNQLVKAVNDGNGY